jgi:flavodoxin-like protein
MRALVVYESMYGNTASIAHHVAAGLRPTLDVTVVPLGAASAELVAAADLLVVGGPTHAHGLSSRGTRKAAVADAAKHEGLTLDPDAAADHGLRDWLAALPSGHDAPSAAFDTRLQAPAPFTGRASRGIARRLRRHGFRRAVKPESFLVDKHNHLVAREAERAETWAGALARAAVGLAPGAPLTGTRAEGG